jgi:NADH dehydrogenase
MAAQAMKVLVVGATGVLGRQAVGRLRARGVAVRAMSRKPDAARDLADQAVEVVAGDLLDRASLDRACAGVKRVLCAAHGMLGRGRYRSEQVDDTGHRALIDAARQAGVERFVYTSMLGASPTHPIDFARTKFAIEQAVQQSGLPNVILRPSAFMEWHVHAFNGKALLDKGKAQLIGPGTKPRNFVAAADVAAFAVMALTEEPAPGPIIEIGGPGNFSNRHVTALYAELAGVEARASHLPAALASALSIVMQPLHPGVARILRLGALPDAAFSETFDSAPLQRAFPSIVLTPLRAFVQARVAEAGPRAHP